MKISFSKTLRRAFTLPETMVATSVGLVLAGVVMALLLESAQEQRLGLGDTTVEEAAYKLQTTLIKDIRMMSSGNGMSPDYTMPYNAPNGSLVGYRGMYAFVVGTNGTYTEHIYYNATNGSVTLVTNTGALATSTFYLATNSTSCLVSNVWFNTSLNPDGSLNSSLVNVVIQMTDNGFSRQSSTNNCASVYRSFSVQMRGY